MEITRHSAALLILLLLRCAASAQQEAPFIEQAQKEFEYGLLQFDLEHWHTAAGHFESVAQKLPVNHRTTAAYVMAARAFLLDEKPSFCLRLIEELQRLYPHSSYLGEGYMIAGDAAVEAGARSTALLWYVQSWYSEHGDHDALRSKIEQLQPRDIPIGERRLVRDYIQRMPADKELISLLEWDARPPGSSKKVRSSDGRNTIDPIRIAVALPMHEKDSRRFDAVRDLRDGMLAALDLHRTDGRFPVVMELLDSENGDSLRRAITRLDRDERAMVLLAGAFSEDAERVCRIAAERGLLVLVPTATAEGLTTHGSNIFQLNTPILQRARLLADFSYLELDAQEAIVLAPKHSYARSMAEAFMRRCRALNIPVHLAGWYGDDGESISQLCAAIAAKGGSKSCILFAPVQSRDDIVAVLEGIRESALSIPIVGGGNWNHPDLLSRHGKGLQLYFESDVVADSTNTEYDRLRRAFSARSSRSVSREALFGFDAMHIALTLIDSDECTRKSVRKNIMDVFEGLRSPVNFQQQRVNAAMNILSSSNGVVRRLEAFHAK